MRRLFVIGLIHLFLAGNGMMAQWVFLGAAAPAPNESVVDMIFVSQQYGMFNTTRFLSPSSGVRTNTYTTLDSGSSWSSSGGPSGPGAGMGMMIGVPHRNTIFMYAKYDMYERKVQKYVDGGFERSVFSGWNIHHMQALDTNSIWVVLQATPISTFSIARYQNGSLGTLAVFGEELVPRRVFFPSVVVGYLTAYAIGSHDREHVILRSDNEGYDWQVVFDDVSVNIRAMHFSSNDHGIAVGDSGLVMTTENGGVDWQMSFLKPYGALRAVTMLNDSVAFIGGDGGRVFRTNNGGSDWDLVSFPSAGAIRKLYFIDEHRLLAHMGLSVYIKDLRHGTMPVELPIAFPNPTSGALVFRAGEYEELRVLDPTGALIHERKIEAALDQVELPRMAAGTYILQLRTIDEQWHALRFLYIDQ